MNIDINDRNDSYNKNIYLIICIIVVALLVVGGTYAYMILSVNATNASYATETTCFDIDYDVTNDDGTLPISGDMFPSSSAKGGLSGKLSLKINEGCNICGVGTLKLNVSSNNILTNTVASHCENSKTLQTMTNYTDSSSCTSNGGIWVTNGSALKYAVYDTNIVTNDTVPLSVGYVNKTGSIDIYGGIDVTKNVSIYYVYIWLDGNLSDNSYSGISFDGNISSSIEQSEDCNNIEGAPEPVLDNGMIPVTISDNGVVTTISKDSKDWYDYSNKEWANVVLVNKEATSGVTGSKSREYYKNNPGTTVVEDDILAYYVWIPRYKYRIRDNIKCSELKNPEKINNPECYGDGYTMSDDDKELFVSWIKAILLSEFSYDVTIEQAASMVDSLLLNGYYEMSGIGYTLDELVEMYNDAIEPDISYNAILNANNIVTGPRPIDILFESKESAKSNGDAINTYYTHPAFTFGDKELDGIWVGKFLTSTIDENPVVLPNIEVSLGNTIKSKFETSLKFSGGTLSNGVVSFSGSDTYGLTANIDSHMMKNSEWGAVVYLSHSKYGINDEMYLNNSYAFPSGSYTGRSGGNVIRKLVNEAEHFNDDTLSTYFFNEYGYYTWLGENVDLSGNIGNFANDRIVGTNASTTGNVTGIYDMSNIMPESKMAVLSDSDGNPRSGLNLSFNSRFNGTVVDDNRNDIAYTDGVPFPNRKYYDLYLQSQFLNGSVIDINLCTLETCGGHALYETLGWYNSAYNLELNYPWFSGGGVGVLTSNSDNNATFSFGGSDGSDMDLFSSMHSVLVVDK